MMMMRRMMAMVVVEETSIDLISTYRFYVHIFTEGNIWSYMCALHTQLRIISHYIFIFKNDMKTKKFFRSGPLKLSTRLLAIAHYIFTGLCITCTVFIVQPGFCSCSFFVLESAECSTSSD